jgi:hypothetical protein
MTETGTATDAALGGLPWVVGERYEVRDAVDRHSLGLGAWLPYAGEASHVLRDESGHWREVHRDDYQLRPTECWVRLIRDVTTDVRQTPPLVWEPSERAGLADELVALGQGDEEAIVRWVRANGFLGIRANPGERSESVEEIRYALACLGQARDILRAIRELKGQELRTEVEHQMSMYPGQLQEAQDDRDRQPMSGTNLARSFGIQVPSGSRNWEGAGAHIQALYCLTSVLAAPLERFLRVQADVAPTEDGMRVQGSIMAAGPLATAYLHTLDEASWPAITYAGSLLRLDWRAPRRCGHCGHTFRPSRRDQHWCGQRCRWANSAASRREAMRLALRGDPERRDEAGAASP